MKKRKVYEIGFKIEPFDNLVIFDLETTGTLPRYDDIIQIAAVRMLAGKIEEDDSFFSYIKPRQPLSPFIISYTGITQNDVKNAPLLSKVLPDFFEYCKDSLLVAHNGQAFDIPFLRNACERLDLKVKNTESIDSMHLSWNVWGRGEVPSHGLDAVVARSKVSMKGIRRHDARGDVMVTAKCVQHMITKLEKNPREISLKINNCLFPY